MTDPTNPTTDPEHEAAATEPEPEQETAPESVAGAAEPETGEPETAEAESDEALVAAAVPEPAPARRRQRQPRAPRGPRPYAVIETGGKQYRVSVGDSISVEKLDIEAGADVTFDRVLLLGGDGMTRVGTPVVTGATVVARIDEQYRGEKIIVFKYKPKKRYRKKMGHRQSLTRLAITAINT